MAGGFGSKPIPIKKEPGVYIKSEFQPSLASLPMAPTPAVKKEASAIKQEFSAVKKENSAVKREFTDDEKPVLGNIPGRRDRGARSSRRRGFGSSLVHRVDGYHIRAHYGNGKVDFTVTKDSPKTRHLNWPEVEREMFRKLHRAHFYIEPTERPSIVTATFTRLGSKYTKLRFSVRVLNIEPRTQPALPAAATYGIYHDTQPDMPPKDAGDDKDKVPLGLGSSSGNEARRSTLEFRQAFLPPNLPEVVSCHLHSGDHEIYYQDIQKGILEHRSG